MAIFEGLSAKLQNTIGRFRGKGRVTEKDVKEMMREIKLALLEADVNYKVVKTFITNVSSAQPARRYWKALRRDSRS